MKKLFIIIVALVMVFSIGACNSAPQDTELEQRVEVLESQVEELEAILVDLEVIEGLNGEKVYYVPQSDVTQLSAMSYETLGGELDKTKAPSYVLDPVTEEYVPFDNVVSKLVTKYLPNTNVSNASIGFQIKIVINTSLSQDEYMARITMLIAELSNYEFYIIGGSELYIQCDFGGTAHIKIPVQTMRSSFITMTPEVIFNGLYEIQMMNMNYDKTQVQTLYDEYIASGTYDGYVLDYK